MTAAYDLDGVLAQAPEPASKPWGKSSGAERQARQEYLLRHYQDAIRLMIPPEEQFHIITARKATPAIQAITRLWCRLSFPEKEMHLRMLDRARTLKNVIEFKAQALWEIKATEFTEDNEKVLRGVMRRLPRLKYFLYADGQRHEIF